MSRLRRAAAATLLLGLGVALGAAWAQTPPPPPAPDRDPPAPADRAQSPRATDGDKAQQLAPVEVRGSRPDDVQERRQSTAAKIIIGREEIDRFGDATLGDVLKRLPGITIQGRAGRGGAIRMRGLGSGYTQILLDGERIPPGFSLDSLTPEQVERIEILRAPTAETGARAIAGTINIITRGGYARRLNDVRLTVGYEAGRWQPSASWTRNVATGPFIVNYSLTAFSRAQGDESVEITRARRLADDALVLRRREDDDSTRRNRGLHLTGRIEWRPEGAGQFTLMPALIASRSSFDARRALAQDIGATPAPFEDATTTGRNDFSLARLHARWDRRIEQGRFELRAGASQSRIDGASFRTERIASAATRTLENRNATRDTNLTAGTKLTRTIFDGHNLVAGAESEWNQRRDDRTTLQDGQPVLTEFGDRLSARAVRLAAYVQDEWNVTPNWSAHAGLRWEAITTRGSGIAGADPPTNRSNVWTPLLHALWKPDPAARDQVRISLTRSYRSPTLQQLIGRPRINTTYPIPGPNTPTDPDFAGNPDLKPELATGVDIAIERYLPGSGVLSANLFRRNITNYLRSVTLLETVPYSATPRYVIRPRNVGRAMTQGLELEAKFRASEVFAGAPRIDIRTNASVFRSRVEEVPGPDNRLDQQPEWTANAGADYRFTGIPLTLGGNLNYTPAYATRISAAQSAYLGRKFVVDAYALWTFNPGLALRVSASNVAAQSAVAGGSVDGPDLQGTPVRESSQTTQQTSLQVQARLELRL